MNEKARAEELIAKARQMIEEQAGLDRVRPLIGDLQQIVHALPASASSTTAGSTSSGGGNGAAAGERARRRRGGRCRVHPRVSRKGASPGPREDERISQAPSRANSTTATGGRLPISTTIASGRSGWPIPASPTRGTDAARLAGRGGQRRNGARHDVRATARLKGCRPYATRCDRSSSVRVCSGSALPARGFDPDRHEAIAARESDAVPDRSIVDVVRPGYMVGDRVLRPARVIVSRRPDGES